MPSGQALTVYRIPNPELPPGAAGRLGLVGQPVLVVVDVQRDWMLAPLQAGISEPEDVEATVTRIEHLVAAARAGGVPVVFCQEVHRRSGVDYGRELDHGEPMRCVESEEATALWASLVPGPEELLVVKRRCSAFFGTELDLLLRSLGAATVVLVGGLTDICVHYTFADAFQRDLHVRVVEDAVVGSSRARHAAALEAMENLHHGARRRADEVAEAFEALTSSVVAAR